MRVSRTGSYDKLFPSGSLKYHLARNLDLHFGYSSTIRRPSYVNLAGVWSINEIAQTVTAPNPRLKPGLHAGAVDAPRRCGLFFDKKRAPVALKSQCTEMPKEAKAT